MIKQNIVRDLILSKVIHGELRAGHELRRDDILKEAGERSHGDRSPQIEVGAAAYRAALQELSDLRVVDVSAGCRTTIRNPSAADLRFEAMIRSSVESITMSSFAKMVRTSNQKHEILGQLSALHEEMEKLAEENATRNQKVDFVFQDFRFHQKICEMSETMCMLPVVSSLFWTFIISGEDSPGDHHTAFDTRQDVTREHRFILDFVERGHASGASAAMRYHLEAAFDRIPGASAEQIEQQLKKVLQESFEVGFDRQVVKKHLSERRLEPQSANESTDLVKLAEAMGMGNR